MYSCLSEAELHELVAGTLAADRLGGAEAHFRECQPCAERLKRINATASGAAISAHHAPTQVEVTSASGTPSGANLAGSHWTDGGVSGASTTTSPPLATNLSVPEFLQQLSQSGLMPEADLDAIREQSTSDPSRGASVPGLVTWLINEKKLTRYQAELLCRGQRAGLVLGNYVILDKLGQGGMGTVFMARHRRMNRLVAIKVLPATLSSIPEAIARFQREMEAAARLSHPNIAAAYDADEAEGVHFLVLEYVDGPNLANYVKEKGPLPIVAAVRLMAQAARGLAAAHSVGIVHRDIKPSNLMINRQGQLKILDMGLAQMRDSSAGLELTSDVTQTGRVMGTVDYMAPEQARDAKNVDYRADIYSLGCTAYFVLTGSTPAPAGSAAEKLLWHQACEASPLLDACPGATPRLESIVKQMMAKKAEDRPQSLEQIAVELDQCLAELPGGNAELSLDGIHIPCDDPSSTAFGSRPGRRTMMNMPNTVVSDLQPTRTFMTPPPEPSRAQSKGQMIAIAAGLAGIVALGAILAAPYVLRPQSRSSSSKHLEAPSSPGTSDALLVVYVSDGPAEVFLDGKLIGTAGEAGAKPLEMPIPTGSQFVQIKRFGYQSHEERVEAKPGQPARITASLRKLAATADPLPVPVSPHAPYEKLLIWVFRNGGSVQATTSQGHPLTLTALDQLPPEPLVVKGIGLAGTGVRNDELAALASAPGLVELSLADTPISDPGLSHLANLRQLSRLNLAKTGVKSAGLAELARLAQLIELDLQQTQITDQGLARLTGLAKLERLYLSDTAVSDVGLEQLKSLKSLKSIGLNNTGVTEAGHQSLMAALPELQIAWDGADAQRAVALRLLEKGVVLAVIDRTGVLQKGLKTRESLPLGRVTVKEADFSTAASLSDDDLRQLVSLPEIELLRLVNVAVTPTGLSILAGLASLKTIDLGTSRIPAAAIDSLKKSLPDCKLIIKEPVDVEVARAVLDAKGQVSVVTERGLTVADLTDQAKLPAGAFSIRTINLDNAAGIDDAFLVKLTELPALESLFLSGTAVTDEGVAQLAACKSLRELSLTGTRVSGAGVGSLDRLPALTRLYLARTDIGSEGARRAASLAGLTHLSLHGVVLADDDLAFLKRLESLEWLDVAETPLTDASIEHLTRLAKLRELTISGTQISDAGQEELAAHFSGPGFRVVGDPLDPQRLAARWVVQNKGAISLESGPLTNLKDLPRTGCQIVSIDLAELPNLKPPEIVKHLAGCRNLQTLVLSDTPLREGDLPFLGGLDSLRELRLANLPVSDASLKALAKLDKLEVLDLSGTRVTGSGLVDLATAAGLRQIYLANAQFDEKYFAAITAFPRLDALDVSAARSISDSGLAVLDQLPGLKTLALRNAKITDASLERIAKLANLESLDLEGTPVTDGGVAKLVGLERLRKLVLNRTSIGDGAINSLAQIKSLKTIGLVRCKVSPESVKQLQAALPGCFVTAPSPPPRDPNNPNGLGTIGQSESPNLP